MIPLDEVSVPLVAQHGLALVLSALALFVVWTLQLKRDTMLEKVAEFAAVVFLAISFAQFLSP